MPEFKPRLIRTLFILPVLLCLLAWALSTISWHELAYWHGPYCGKGQIVWGSAYLTYETEARHRADGFTRDSEPRPFRLVSPVFFHLGFSAFLGFKYQYSTTPLGPTPAFPTTCTAYTLGVPFWFLILASCAALLLVWRKTAQRQNAQGFPIEPGAKHA